MPRRDFYVALLLALVLVVLLSPLARQGVDPHHDGIMLKPALDVLSGQVLFRDTFTQYGALTTYLQVAVLWFEPTLLALRLMTVAAYALVLFFLYAIWRQILPRSLTVVSCGLFVLFIPVYEKDWLGQFWLLLPWSSVYALLFQAITLYALFNVIRDNRAKGWGLVLGAACAAIFWCRQPVGVVTTGCVALSWLALQLAGWTPLHDSKRSILGRMIAGFMLINTLMLSSVVLTAAVPEWWYQNFTWPAKWARDMDQNIYMSFFVHPGNGTGVELLLLLLLAVAPGLLSNLKFQPRLRWLTAYYISLAAGLIWQHERVRQVLALRDGGWSALIPVIIMATALVCLVLVFRKRSTPHSTEYYLVAALAALSAGAVLQYYPLPDPFHVVWALAPGFGLIPYVLWRGSRWPGPVVALALAAAVAPAAWVKIGSARQDLIRPLVTLDRPAVLKGMRVPAEMAQRLTRITALLDQVERQRPGIPSVVIGNDALYLCFAKNLANPSPYYVTWLGLTENTENQRRWNSIHETRPVMYLQLVRWNVVGDFYRKAHYVPVLYFDEVGLEVAIPQEIADALGITTYGAPKPGGAGHPAVKN